MQSEHTLILSDNTIILQGFETITTQATFNLYNSGIVITHLSLPEGLYRYRVRVDNHKIYDANLAAILSGRAYKAKETFFYANHHYYETTLHKQKQSR